MLVDQPQDVLQLPTDSLEPYFMTVSNLSNSRSNTPRHRTNDCTLPSAANMGAGISLGGVTVT